MITAHRFVEHLQNAGGLSRELSEMTTLLYRIVKQYGPKVAAQRIVPQAFAEYSEGLNYMKLLIQAWLWKSGTLFQLSTRMKYLLPWLQWTVMGRTISDDALPFGATAIRTADDIGVSLRQEQQIYKRTLHGDIEKLLR